MRQQVTLAAVANLTLREIAAEHGYALNYVRTLAQRPDWPPPMGTTHPKHHPGGPANLYDQAAVGDWMNRHVLADTQWTLSTIAAEIGKPYQTVQGWRRRGRLPPPDGHRGPRPWWKPSQTPGIWGSWLTDQP